MPDDIAPLNRLGVIIPYTDREEDGSAYHVLLPEREEDGTLALEASVFSGSDLSERYQDGFMPYSREALVQFARTLNDVPYGYGDLHCHYDCSSYVSLVYRCFGIFLPRNSADMLHAKGLTVVDLTAMEDEEKETLIMEHPGAIIFLPGHVMLSTGEVHPPDYGTRAGIIHCNTAYYSEPDGDPAHYVVTEKVLENLIARCFSVSGRSFLTKAEALIFAE